jgi:serine/threonine-protein phosphatase Stp1
MRFETVANTHVGCVRLINEDAFLSRPDKGLWAVADGMGGHDSGEVASALIVELLDACDNGPDLAARVHDCDAALQDANARLMAMAQAGGANRTIGSTVVVLAADATRFVCLWVGDSRAYLARDGKLKQLTKDHSLVQELVDAGALSPADAHDHPNANIITRAVGSETPLEIDRVEGRVANGDTFLLASDGLTGLMSDAEIVAALRAADLDAEADRLLVECLLRGAPDNVTFVILRAR